jgi:6-phosphogluconolactonase (cycloisomerase 2 family)
MIVFFNKYISLISLLILFSLSTVFVIGCSSGSSSSTKQLQTIIISPASTTIYMNTNAQYTATAQYSDGSTLDITQYVLWNSSNPSVATISNTQESNGLAVAVTSGSTNITATLYGITSSISTLTVSNATLDNIIITSNNTSIHIGTKEQYTATGNYSDGGTQNLTTLVTWISLDNNIATISNTTGSYGIATAVNTGSTTITATFGTISNSVALEVVSGSLQSITITPNNSTININTTQQYLAAGQYSDGTSQDITISVSWNSFTPTIATISNTQGSNGLATALTTGIVIINAQLGNITGFAILTVTSATLVSIVITPIDQVVDSIGQNLQLTAIGYYNDSHTQDLTSLVNWQSSNTQAVSVSNITGSNGVATSIAIGVSTISAILNNVTGNTNVTVAAPTDHYTYVVNELGQNISIYDIGNDGILTTQAPTEGLPITGYQPYAITLNSSNTFAYVTNNGDNNISSYRVDQNTGYLTSLIANVATGNKPTGIAISPSNAFAYVANWQDDTVYTYGINATTGILTLSSQVNVGINPSQIIVAPSGRYVYVVSTQGIYVFSSSVNGALTLLSTTSPVGVTFYSIAITPSGNYLYATSVSNSSIYVYSITSGTLSTIPVQTITQNAPNTITISASGEYAYVTDTSSNTVNMYAINSSTGNLTALSPASIATGSIPYALTITPSGNYVYVINNDPLLPSYNIYMYGVNSISGVLNPLTLPSFTIGTQPIAITSW